MGARSHAKQVKQNVDGLEAKRICTAASNRACKIHARESLVDLWTLGQRLATLVTDSGAIYI
eukprot:6198735-Pleurochrysis_carterae.AAC.1